MKKKNMNQSLKVIHKIILGLWGLFLSFFIVFTAIGLVVAFIPNEYFNVEMSKIALLRTGSFSIEFMNGLRYSLNDSAIDKIINVKSLLTSVMITGLCYSFVLQYIFKQLKIILKSTIERCPFDEKNSKAIFKMACLMLGAGVIFPILRGFIYHNLINGFGLNHFSVAYTFDFYWILTGVLLLILSYIFKYGSFLQTEYDETL